MLDFLTSDEMKNYLKTQKETDKWIDCPISKCSVYVEEDARSKIDTTEISEESILDCISDTGLFLKFYDKNKRKCVVIPLRYTAIATLFSRAGVGGRSFYNTEERAGMRILPLKEKAAFLTKCLKLYDETCKVLVRDEKVSAVLSNVYAVLPMYDLEESISHLLEREYPMSKLQNGQITHEYISLVWNLNEEDMENELKDRIEEFGGFAKEVTSSLKFVTSDIGNANASVFPYFTVDGNMLRCGKPIEIKHMGKKTVEDFAKKLPQLNSMFKNDIDRLSKLYDIEIHHPADCFRAIAKYVGLPKKLSMKLATEMEHMTKCTAFEIYFHLHDIMNVAQDQNDSMTVTTMLRLQESVASTLYLNFKDFDYPFAWNKGEE